MALYISNISQTSFYANWSSHGSTVKYYNLEVYRGSSLVWSQYNISSSTYSRYIGGLSSGTYYEVKLYSKNSSNSTVRVEYAYATTTSPAINVGSMGSIYTNLSTRGRVTLSWNPVSNATYYVAELYYGSSTYGSLIDYDYSIGGTAKTFTGLSDGTTYTAKVYGARSGSPNGGYNTVTFTTPTYRVGSISSLTLTPSTSSGSIVYASWSSATYASYYALEVYTSSGRFVTSNYNISGTSYTITGLSENTQYRVRVYGWASGYDNGSPIERYVTTTSFNVGSLTGLGASASTTSGAINVWWNSATNATGYRIEVYRGNTTSSSYLVYSTSTSSTSAYVSGLLEYNLYTVKVYGTRSGYPNGGYSTTTVTTADVTPPSISGVTGDGKGRVYFSWNATDSGSGMRSTSTYRTEISNDGTNFSQSEYTTNKYRTFTKDYYGNAFTHNTWYTLKVVAYDNSGNSSFTTVRVQYKISRPTNWSWHTTKSKGGSINVTASEWNSFCARINQFRQYKDLSNYSFTSVSSGTLITASIVNQAVTAINAMSPPTSALSASKGGVITADFFNRLRDSLNSIG